MKIALLGNCQLQQIGWLLKAFFQTQQLEHEINSRAGERLLTWEHCAQRRWTLLRSVVTWWRESNDAAPLRRLDESYLMRERRRRRQSGRYGHSRRTGHWGSIPGDKAEQR